jgi:small multidrug resistance family-3 protein
LVENGFLHLKRWSGIAARYAKNRRHAFDLDLTARQAHYAAMLIKTFLLFVVTAVAEITGCYLPYAWLRKGGSPWLLIPAAFSLAVFAWLLTMHPAASGRVYAAYGCVYGVTALFWLKVVDGVPLTATDLTGGGVALAGMLIIVSGWEKTI